MDVDGAADSEKKPIQQLVCLWSGEMGIRLQGCVEKGKCGIKNSLHLRKMHQRRQLERWL